MEVSLFLAKVFGPFLLIIGLAEIINVKQFQNMVRGWIKSDSMLPGSGMLALMTGLLIVVTQNVWAFKWPVVLTLIGWYALAKGVLYLLFPDTARSWLKKYDKRDWYIVEGLVAIVIGAYLVFIAYFS